MARRAAIVAALGTVVAAPAAGQDGERRSGKAARTDTPPVIDGRLDDAAWQAATPIGELIQLEPIEGAEPSEASDIRVLYDQDHLYLGLRFFDREPDKIVSTTRERDAFLSGDDRVEIVIDTFLDRRNAFWFQMNAGGSKGDALITNNGANFNKPWDGIWEGRARIDDQGWVAELAIPFKTLSFEQGLETWGFNIQRYIGRLNEEDEWAKADQDIRFFAVGEAGDLTGISGIRQGVGLDIIPFFVARGVNDRANGPSEQSLLGELGLDAFYKVTPNLTFSATVNTDFAETEVDDQIVNLTRFPLFFPERRDFFLQDAGLFEFADLSPGFGRGRPDLIPFFSRRIGLSEDGEQIPIIAGAKLTGRIGDYNVGLLDVVQDEFEFIDDQDRLVTQGVENLAVARISKNVLEQSTIGGIFTYGDPTQTDPSQPTRNAVLGLDANYRTSEFLGDKTLKSSVWFLQSESTGSTGNQAAYGAAVDYPNNIWSWNAAFKEIQPNFDAALGFVPRENIRKYDAGIDYSPRIGSTVRNLQFEIDTTAVTDTDDKLETWTTEVQPLGINWNSGDRGQIEARFVRDTLLEDFEIAPDVTIPIGSYDWVRGAVEFQSADNRPLAFEIDISGGGFFDGTREDYETGLTWRPGPLFTGSIDYEQNDVHLPDGSFTERTVRTRANFSFTPELSWNNFVQWDTRSDTIGFNSRLRWIPRPGQDIFLVFNQTLDEARDSLVPIFQELAFKITYTIRL